MISTYKNHKYRISGCVIFLSAFMCLLSCDDNLHKNQDYLERAQSLIIQDPDSAEILLSKVDNNHSSKHQRSICDLINLELLYYKGRCSEDTSKIARILDDLHKAEDNNNIIKAYYHSALIKKNIKSYPEAVIDLLRGEKFAVEANDSLYMALIYRSLGDLYDEMLINDESYKYYLKSNKLFQALNNERYLPYSYYDLARINFNRFKIKEALSQLNKILEMYKHSGNEGLILDCKMLKLLCLFILNRYQDVIGLYEDLKLNENFQLSDRIIADVGISYLNLGKIDEAQKISESLPEDSWLNLELAETKSDYKSAYKKLISEYNNQNEAFYELVSREYNAKVSNYLSQERLIAESHAKRLRERAIWIVLMCIVLLIIVIGIARNRLLKVKIAAKQDRAAVKKLQIILEDYKSKEESHKIQLSDNKIMARSQINVRYGLIDELCSIIETNSENRNLHKIIFNKVSEFINLMTKDPELLKTLEADINYYYDNAISIMRNSLPKIKEDDVRFYIFSVLGFSTTTLMSYFKVNSNTIYNRKKNLKNRIKKYCGKNADRLMSYMD